jgi:hypothetical protein
VAGAPSVVYVPRAGATPEGELAALAAVYAFALERHEHEQTAAEPPADANATEVECEDMPGEARAADWGGGRHVEEG